MHHNTKVMSDQAAEHLQMGVPFSLDPFSLKKGRRGGEEGSRIGGEAM